MNEAINCGLTKEDKTTFDQKMVVDYTLDDIRLDDFDALAIPGGFEEYGFYEDGFSEALLHVHEFDKLSAKTGYDPPPCVKRLYSFQNLYGFFTFSSI